MTSILVIDDHPVVALGLKQIIAEEMPGAVVVETRTAGEALHQLAKTRFRFIILDLILPGHGGLEFLAELHHAYPATPILVLSIQDEEHYAVRAMRAGAAGYLNKASDRHEIVAAMHKVAAGEKYLSSALAEKIALNKVIPARTDLLSNREYEILGGIAAGKRLTAIAHDLSLSVKTVSTHKRRIMAKLGAANDAELIRYTIERIIPRAN
jgi:two-component system invasion response regulator UvrY